MSLEVALTAIRCTVFLIGGRFKAGGEEYSEHGEGYLVEDEETIELQRLTVVVIIDKN